MQVRFHHQNDSLITGHFLHLCLHGIKPGKLAGPLSVMPRYDLVPPVLLRSEGDRRDDPTLLDALNQLIHVLVQLLFACQQAVTKERMMAYKKYLIEKGYAASSINSMLASLNSLLDFQGWSDCKVKNIKTQRQTYCAEEKELTKSEYLRLLEVAKDRPQLHLILETICGFLYCHFYLRFYHLFTYFSCAP